MNTIGSFKEISISKLFTRNYLTILNGRHSTYFPSTRVLYSNLLGLLNTSPVLNIKKM